MGDKKMETMAANIRKLDFPASAEQALAFIHAQCQKFSHSGVPSPGELSSLIEFIDEFIFSAGIVKGTKSQGKKFRRMTHLQQLQLIQVLSDYFCSDADFNLLCSVYMILFMVQGRDIDNKVVVIGSWCKCCDNIKFWRCLGDTTNTNFNSQSQCSKSPLFTANLIASIGELYSGVGRDGHIFSPAPSQVVNLVTVWLRGSPQLCETGGRGGPGSIPVTGTSPVASLLVWPVLAPLVGKEENQYSLLHHTLIETILTDNATSKVPQQYLIHLAKSILERLQNQTYSEEQICLALDRFGQILSATTRMGAGVKPDRELLALMKKMPKNRLINIVLKSFS